MKSVSLPRHKDESGDEDVRMMCSGKRSENGFPCDEEFRPCCFCWLYFCGVCVKVILAHTHPCIRHIQTSAITEGLHITHDHPIPIYSKYMCAQATSARFDIYNAYEVAVRGGCADGN